MMRKLLLFLVLITFVASSSSRIPKQLTEEQKQTIKRLTIIVKELAKTFPNDAWDDILDWLKKIGCIVAPYVCEEFFPSKLCDDAIGELCNKN